MGGLEAGITQAEVEKALPKLSNGMATWRAGWPAELLRHAAYHVTLDSGCKVKIWMLAPILASFLTASSGAAVSLRQLCFGPPNAQEGARRRSCQL